MFPRNVVTLNIEAQDVRFLVTRGKQVLDWGSIPLAAGLVKQGLVADPAKVSSAINTLFSEKKLRRRGVVAGLTGLRSVLRTVYFRSAPLLIISIITASRRTPPLTTIWK